MDIINNEIDGNCKVMVYYIEDIEFFRLFIGSSDILINVIRVGMNFFEG